jgi:hypothetical protein
VRTSALGLYPSNPVTSNNLSIVEVERSWMRYIGLCRRNSAMIAVAWNIFLSIRESFCFIGRRITCLACASGAPATRITRADDETQRASFAMTFQDIKKLKLKVSRFTCLRRPRLIVLHRLHQIFCIPFFIPPPAIAGGRSSI